MTQNENQNPFTHDKIVLEWETPEFIPHPKGLKWFLAAGMLFLVFTAYAILSGSATMAIVFIMLTGVYYLTHNQAPRIIRVQVTEMGVRVDDKFYPFNQINAFWIVYNPPYVQRLYLRLGSKTHREIKVELNRQNPVELRRALAREIPETEEGGENLSDILIRLLRLQ